MPVKNAGLRNGPRFNIVNKELHRRFCDATGIDISYTDFTRIIYTSNSVIRRIFIENTQGFKFPESLGIGCVTRYKPKISSRSIDWQKSKEHGVKVYHTNFHSFGYKPRIMWYADSLARCKYMSIYKFIPDRSLSRGVSIQMKVGKIYNEYGYGHFKAKKIRLGKINKQ